MNDPVPAVETDAPTLSVVIFVKNEPVGIERCVRGITTALAATEWRDPEVVVVDDGSTDDTAHILDDLADNDELPVRVHAIHQKNTGRLIACLNGLRAARGEYILILGSRFLMDADALRAGLKGVRGGRVAQNADCKIETTGVYARFWDALPRIFWARYISNPVDMSFGLENFDLYPKGTGGFLAPREVLLDAYASFTTRFADLREANDDTSLLRHVAARHQIWLSPDYRCRYWSRTSWRRFLPHAMHRGIHFVDGYFRRDSPFMPVLVAFYPLSLAAAVATLRWPAVPFAGVGAVTLVLTAAGLARRLPPKHLGALITVTPMFTIAYGVGLWRGLALALTTKLRGPTNVLGH